MRGLGSGETKRHYIKTDFADTNGFGNVVLDDWDILIRTLGAQDPTTVTTTQHNTTKEYQITQERWQCETSKQVTIVW